MRRKYEKNLKNINLIEKFLNESDNLSYQCDLRNQHYLNININQYPNVFVHSYTYLVMCLMKCFDPLNLYINILTHIFYIISHFNSFTLLLIFFIEYIVILVSCWVILHFTFNLTSLLLYTMTLSIDWQ